MFRVLLFFRKGGRPGAVVKAACSDSLRSRVRTLLWPSSFKAKIQYCGKLPCRGVACSALDDRARISSSVSGGSCDLSHHPQEVQPICAQSGLKHHSLHFILRENRLEPF